MAAKNKSVFYHTRWNKVQLNHERVAEILGASVEQIEARDIEEDAPEAAIRLLILFSVIASSHCENEVGYPPVQGIQRVKQDSRGRRRHQPSPGRPIKAFAKIATPCHSCLIRLSKKSYDGA